MNILDGKKTHLAAAAWALLAVYLVLQGEITGQELFERLIQSGGLSALRIGVSKG